MFLAKQELFMQHSKDTENSAACFSRTVASVIIVVQMQLYWFRVLSVQLALSSARLPSKPHEQRTAPPAPTPPQKN
eukprot:5761923-Amphidinium_carterae.1